MLLLLVVAAAVHAGEPRLWDVSVVDNFFSPAELTIQVGDTVRWTNVSGHHHNVLSCVADQLGCDGATAAESFGSGLASGFWVYDHTFTVVGVNPYVCQPHASFMQGTIVVQAAPGAPPEVPDGSSGAPLTATKGDPQGSALVVDWDADCSGAGGYRIVWGSGADLPVAPGGTFGVGGAVCDTGPPPYTWNGSPAAASPGVLVWWIVVATDGATLEGAWGDDGSGAERNGPGAAGSSATCGVTGKDPSGGCGP